LDTNGNNQFDVWERSSLTDANGVYQFTGLRVGTHDVASSRGPGWEATTATPISVEINTSGQVFVTPDAGYSLQSLGPVGPEQVVNYLATASGAPTVAVDANGNYAIAWSDQSDVFVRLFNADGTPNASAPDEIQVNTTTGARFPHIAMADDGRFAVAWDGEETILAQLYDKNGNAVGGEIDAVPTLKNTQSAFPYGIDMDSNGNFAVLYDLVTTKGAFTDGGPISVQRFDANGTRLGRAIKVSDYSLINGGRHFAMAPDGSFAVTWNDNRQIFVKRYTASGSEITPLITIDTLVSALNP
jgi:hypothetical protein